VELLIEIKKVPFWLGIFLAACPGNQNYTPWQE
jgi:hypothetical protein